MKIVSEAHIPDTRRSSMLGYCLRNVADLLLRPERFFRGYLALQPGAAPLFLVWIVGVASLVDRVGSESLGASGLFRSEGQAIADLGTLDWSAFWLYAAFGGIVFGLFEWFVFGWWYRQRLVFCGAVAPDPMEARLVFAHARLVWHLPFLVTVLLSIPFHDNYRALMDSDSLAMVWVTAPIWSAFVGYRGAVGCFDVDPKWARFWFLILPIVLLTAMMLFWTAMIP